MRILLDTCTFLWYCLDSPDLSTYAKDLIVSPQNQPCLSAVSSWEISVKFNLKKLNLPEAPEKYIPRIRQAHRIQTLSLNEEATLYLAKLPNHHRDPFDRMLVCQSIVSGIPILTPDSAIAQYPIKTIW